MKILLALLLTLSAALIGCQSTPTETPAAAENNFVQVTVEKSITLYNQGKPAALMNVCNRDNVSCYLNAKMYPAKKPMTDGLYHKVAFSKTYNLKTKTSQKLDITIYESKK